MNHLGAVAILSLALAIGLWIASVVGQTALAVAHAGAALP